MNVLILLMSLISFATLAGPTQNDYFIDASRHIFKLAKTPTLKDLQLNKRWACGMYNARPLVLDGGHGVDINLLKFTKSSKGIENESFLFKQIEPFKFTKLGMTTTFLSGINGKREYQLTVRSYRNALIAEVATTWNDKSWSKSITDSNLKATHYYYCQVLDFDRKNPPAKIYDVFRRD